MLPKSRLLSFIDKNSEFSLHFIEGQKIVHDLAIIHELKGQGFAYFRDSILSAIPLVTLLKFKESLGFYIDSKDPYFLLKIEMSEAGEFRTLLLPETFNEFPNKLKGEGRLSKISEGMTTPYTSIIGINGLNFHQIVNQILKESYQIKGEVILSDESDQSVFIMQLPKKNWDKENPTPEPDLNEFLSKTTPKLQELFKKGSFEETEIVDFLESKGFTFLTGKDLNFKCNCSYDRMIMGVEALMRSSSIDEVFGSDSKIEIKCDYCKTFYEIPKSTFLKN